MFIAAAIGNLFLFVTVSVLKINSGKTEDVSSFTAKPGHEMLFPNVTEKYDSWATWLSASFRALRVNCMCNDKQVLGDINRDGYKVYCPDMVPKEGCLVYSLGSNGNFDFENAVHERYPQCEIHTFDQLDFRAPDFVRFHRVRFGPDRTISQVQEELGHKDKRIALFKIDIEGAEWSLLQDIFSPSFDQIEMEIHNPTVALLKKLQSYASQHFCLADVNPNVISLTAAELLFVNEKRKK